MFVGSAKFGFYNKKPFNKMKTYEMSSLYY